MTIEYERKYLVNVKPGSLSDLLPHIESKKKIVQGYLSTDPDKTIRVRRVINGNSCMTVKGRKIDGECTEIEFQIPPIQAEYLIKMCTSLIYKTRYDVLWGGMKFELDSFEGDLAGLELVELEGDRDKIENFIIECGLPSWISREVTDDSFFSNSNLSTQTWRSVLNHIQETEGRK